MAGRAWQGATTDGPGEARPTDRRPPPRWPVWLGHRARCFRLQGDGDSATVWTVLLRPGKHRHPEMPPTRSAAALVPQRAQHLLTTQHRRWERGEDASPAKHPTPMTSPSPVPLPGCSVNNHQTPPTPHTHLPTLAHSPTHTYIHTRPYTPIIHRGRGPRGESYLSYSVFD